MMLAKLQLELNSDEISYRNASLFQGILFEHISEKYGELLHAKSMHPYSQRILKEDGKTIWEINTLNETAYQEIILPLLENSFQSVHLNKKEKEIDITNKQLKTMKKKQLMDAFYNNEAAKEHDLRFLSATAFRQNNRFYILPDVRLIFQNLMNKYSDCSEHVDMWDEDTLIQLTGFAYISRYTIRSVIFPSEGINIPGFIGDIRIRTDGQETLRRFVSFLLAFSEFAGIGVKTGMGMGAVKIITEGRDEE